MLTFLAFMIIIWVFESELNTLVKCWENDGFGGSLNAFSKVGMNIKKKMKYKFIIVMSFICHAESAFFF